MHIANTTMDNLFGMVDSVSKGAQALAPAVNNMAGTINSGISTMVPMMDRGVDSLLGQMNQFMPPARQAQMTCPCCANGPTPGCPYSQQNAGGTDETGGGLTDVLSAVGPIVSTVLSLL